MQTYILFEKVRGTWVKLGEYDDPTTLARMAYHLGCLHGTKPTEIKVETIDNMTEQLASAPWISVEERLPENYRVVLVIKDHPVDYLHGYEFAARYTNGEWSGNSRKVLYWMPLPEPPKEGTSE